MEKKTAEEVLKNVNKMLTEAEYYKKHNGKIKWYLDSLKICEDLSIWKYQDRIMTVSKLKEMKKFLENAIKLGFTGHAFFLVGKKGYGHGMWVYKNYHPYNKINECLYHSFVNGKNYYNYIDKEGKYLGDKISGKTYRREFTLKEIEQEIKKGV